MIIFSTDLSGVYFVNLSEISEKCNSNVLFWDSVHNDITEKKHQINSKKLEPFDFCHFCLTNDSN